MSIKDSIVRILNNTGNTVGTGFVISKRHILTCNHVIQEKVGQTVNVIFAATNELVSTTVVSQHEQEDIAILYCLSFIPDTVGCVLIGSSKNSQGHSFTTFGYPAIQANGLWAHGKIIGEIDNKKDVAQLQIQSQDLNKGMSGSPIFDTELNQVVGMFQSVNNTTNNKHRDLGFALPTNVIKKVWPELPLMSLETPSPTIIKYPDYNFIWRGILNSPERLIRQCLQTLRTRNENELINLLWACCCVQFFSPQVLEVVLGVEIPQSSWNWLSSQPFIQEDCLMDKNSSIVRKLSPKAHDYLLSQAKLEGILDLMCAKVIEYYLLQTKKNSGRQLNHLSHINYLHSIFKSSKYLPQDYSSHIAAAFDNARKGYDISSCEMIVEYSKRYMSKKQLSSYYEKLRFLRGQPVNPIRFGEVLTRDYMGFLVPLGYTSFPYFFAGQVMATYAHNSQAIDFFRRACNLDSGDRKGYYLNRMGLAYVCLGNLENAEDYFLKATSLIQNMSDDWYDLQLNWIILYTKSGDWYAAKQISENLSEHMSEMPVYLQSKYSHLVGTVCLYLNDLQNAERMAIESQKLSEKVGGVFDRVVGRMWREMFAATLKGNIALKIGDITQAIHCFEYALEHTPWELTFPRKRAHYVASESQVFLGRAYYQNGEIDKSKNQLRRIIDENKNELYWRLLGHIELAEIYIHINEIENALQHLTIAVNESRKRNFYQLLYKALMRLDKLNPTVGYSEEIANIPEAFRLEI